MTSFRHAGLINKGNTCYANSILQVFSVIPSLWSQWPSESPNVSALVKSVILNMSLLNHAFSPIDPSNFLRALEHKISSIRGTPFKYNTQQDVLLLNPFYTQCYTVQPFVFVICLVCKFVFNACNYIVLLQKAGHKPVFCFTEIPCNKGE